VNKRIGIITMTGNDNFGNRLQNYALQEKIKAMGLDCYTLKNYYWSNNNRHYYRRIIKHKLIEIKKYIKQKSKEKNLKKNRTNRFNEFDRNIKFDSKIITAKNCKAFNYDKYVVGSDQVWNPRFGSLSEIELLKFVEPKKRVSYAASFGISKLPEEYKDFARKELNKFNNISVRENEGKAIVEELTNRKDVEVLVDPTMLLSVEEWDKVSKKPENLKEGKYILNYFLGKIPEDRDKEIKRIAKENGYYIINILDKEDPLYCSGPSEFVYLEKHAELICTDSFHSVVFAILFNRPFIVFERKENNNNNMSSRLYTLLSKFSLTDRFFQERIDDKLLKNNYENVYKVLEEERIKSNEFLKKALKS